MVFRHACVIRFLGQVVDVSRGRWFVDGTWQPLDEEYAEIIETEHLNKFGTSVVVDQESGEIRAETDKGNWFLPSLSSNV